MKSEAFDRFQEPIVFLKIGFKGNLIYDDLTRLIPQNRIPPAENSILQEGGEN